MVHLSMCNLGGAGNRRKVGVKSIFIMRESLCSQTESCEFRIKVTF